MTHFINVVEPKMIVCEANLVPVVRKSMLSNNSPATLYTFLPMSEMKSVDDLVNGWDEPTFKYE